MPMAERFLPPKSERGAALLTVLLLVAVMAVISATALDRLRLSTRLAVNGAAMAQARAYSLVAEGIAAARIEDLLARDAAQLTNDGNWLDRDVPVPVDRGQATARLSDGQNCFNLNSLVSGQDGQFSASGAHIRQLAKLMELLGIAAADAAIIADSTADWIDSDGNALPSGAEDGFYRGQREGYLTANRLMIDRGELRAVRGMTPVYYARLKPFICALPVAEPVRFNVNTLSPDRAILLSALTDGRLAPAEAKTILAGRPSAGFGSTVKFWADPRLAALQIPSDIQGQISVTSSWFFLQTRVSAGAIELESHALIQASGVPARILWRSWGEAG
jgi:general secretion pathway protein K